jgi:hypothetical protein
MMRMASNDDGNGNGGKINGDREKGGWRVTATRAMAMAITVVGDNEGNGNGMRVVGDKNGKGG